MIAMRMTRRICSIRLWWMRIRARPGHGSRRTTRQVVARCNQYQLRQLPAGGPGEQGFAGRLRRQPCADPNQRGRVHQVGLAEDDQIGGRELAPDQVTDVSISRLCLNRLGVSYHDDDIEDEPPISGDDICQLTQIRNAARFDDDLFGSELSFRQIVQCEGNITSDTTADAAVGQLYGFAATVTDQGGVDIDTAEIVDDYGKAHVLYSGQYLIEQGRFSGSQVATNNRDEAPADHVSSVRNGKDLAAEDGGQHTNVFDGDRGNFQRIFGQQGEVGTLANPDAADLVVTVQQPGGIHRHHP